MKTSMPVDPQVVDPQTIHNFGRNVCFHPKEIHQPKSEDDVLRILAEHQGARVRIVGRLHSYSEAACCEDVMLDLRHMNDVRIEQRDNGYWATIGAGCQVKRVLAELERQAGLTMPAVGLITEQAIVGALSTGTHGSGRHSLSHYVAEVRIAAYDAETGKPVIRTINDGPEVRAARCSLGCLGVIVSVSFWVRPQYCVEEHFRRYDTLVEVIAAEDAFPLQQFYVLPWRWDYWVQHRREVSAPRRWSAGLYQAYFFATMEVGLHLVVLFLSQWCRLRWATHFFFRRVLPLTVIRGWKVVGKSQDLLVMEHELFRHVEIELFVKRSKLEAALSFVRELVSYFDGDDTALSAVTRERMGERVARPDQREGRGARLEDTPFAEGSGRATQPVVPNTQFASVSLGLLKPTDIGAYTHRYPICVRRIRPDDTLISMASSDDEDHYSISFNCYERLSELHGFNRFCEVLTRSMAHLFEARPHWGKICPIDAEIVKSLYPHLAEFQQLSTEFDPSGRFRNDWVTRLLFRD